MKLAPYVGERITERNPAKHVKWTTWWGALGMTEQMYKTSIWLRVQTPYSPSMNTKLTPGQHLLNVLLPLLWYKIQYLTWCTVKALDFKPQFNFYFETRKHRQLTDIFVLCTKNIHCLMLYLPLRSFGPIIWGQKVAFRPKQLWLGRPHGVVLSCIEFYSRHTYPKGFPR